MLSRLDARLQSELQDAAWLNSQGPDAILLLKAISDLSEHTSIPSNIDIENTVSIIRTLKQQSWYADGLTITEEKRLTALFSAVHYLAAYNVNLDLSSLAKSAFDNSHWLDVKLYDKTVVLMVALSDATEAQRILQAGEQGIVALSQFFKASDAPPAVVIAFYAGLPRCVTFDLDTYALIILNTSCDDSFNLDHEIVHSFGTQFPPWYKEGLPILLSAVTSNSLDRADGLASQFVARLGHVPTISPAAIQDETEEQGLAGFLFLRDVYELLGTDSFAAITRGAGEGMSTEQILDLIRSNSPAALRAKVDGLINRWVSR